MRRIVLSLSVLFVLITCMISGEFAICLALVRFVCVIFWIYGMGFCGIRFLCTDNFVGIGDVGRVVLWGILF